MKLAVLCPMLLKTRKIAECARTRILSPPVLVSPAREQVMQNTQCMLSVKGSAVTKKKNWQQVPPPHIQQQEGEPRVSSPVC